LLRPIQSKTRNPQRPEGEAGKLPYKEELTSIKSKNRWGQLRLAGVKKKKGDANADFALPVRGLEILGQRQRTAKEQKKKMKRGGDTYRKKIASVRKKKGPGIAKLAI